MRLLLLLLALAVPLQAGAFCGFFVSGADSALYNNASQVVLMRKGQRTVLSMSNAYQGPPEDFAMVVPVPVVLQKEQVKTLPLDVFSRIDQLSAPRLVEYWETDPCFVAYPEEEEGAMMPGNGVVYDDGDVDVEKKDYHVKVEAQFKAGEYEVVILSAEEADGLERWLVDHKYKIPAGAGEALAPYIRSGMKFFVAKVDIKAVKKDAHGKVVLSPLRFHYEEEQLRLPVRLGLLNANGKQDLIVYVLNPEARFEAANYTNVFIPSNLEVLDEIRKDFGGFYAQLFDETMAAANNRAVVTEYAWQAGSCDPCPVPPLQPSDIFTLGGDVFGEAKGEGPNGADRNQPYFGDASTWVLTRLHTRYDQKTLSEDLIFVPAKPVVGGRGSEGISREKPGAVEPDSVNNFQGRYIIRHYWAGEVKCDAPQFGRWGGPPEGGNGLQAAQDLAEAKRGTTQLAQVVKSALPQLKLPGMPEPKRPQGK